MRDIIGLMKRRHVSMKQEKKVTRGFVGGKKNIRKFEKQGMLWG